MPRHTAVIHVDFESHLDGPEPEEPDSEPADSADAS